MNSTTTVGIEVKADGTQKAARDLADVDASLKKIQTDLGGTAQPAGVVSQGLEQLGAAGKSAGAGLGAAGQAAGAAAPKLSGVGASAKKAAEGLGTVSKFASTAKFDKLTTDLSAMGVKLNANSLHAQKLARAMQQVERERAFQQLAADANLSTLQLAKFRAEIGDTRGALATLSNGFGLSKAAVLAFAAALTFGGKAALDAALQMDRLEKAYTTITGSSSAAQAQLGYLYDVSNRLGLQFQSTAESAKTFFAAGKGTTLEKDLNSVFEAVASAGSALSLSQDDMQGAFLALGQMISKGKVQAEELRGQLGERLPGAFQLAAKAMGMTTAQLDKFMADGKLTAEDLLPKLAKVMKEDFGAAAEVAANGLQGQLNRLSTEWTRLKASIVDSDSAASAVSSLAQAMKSLADNGATVGAIISKVLQFAAWTAGVYAFIKALGGLVTVFTTLKAVSSAVSFAGIVSGAGAIAVVVAAAAVAITSLCTSTTNADDIFRKYQTTIDAYKQKMGEAAEEVRNFTAEQDEAYKKSLERQRDVLKTDIAAATQSINSALSGIRFLSFDQIFSADGTQFVEARSEIEALGRELAKLGQNITQEDLDAYAAKVRAIDERMRAAGLATKAWNDAVDKLLYSNDAFVKNLSALIAKGMSVEDALRQLAAEAERTKVAVGSGWNIDIDNVTKGINAMEHSIRSMQSEMLGGKVFEKVVSSLPKDFPLEKAKEIFDLYKRTPNLEPWQRAGQLATTLGDQYVAMGEDAIKGVDELFSAGAELGKTQTKYDAYQKSLRESAKDHTSAYNQMENNLASYVSELNQTKSSIQSLQAQLATKPGEVFTREQNKIAADYRATVEKINAEATKYANKKGITKTQAEELKQSRLQEASLQKNLDLRLAQEKEEKRLADLAKDRYEFYKELEEITGQYGLSLQFQSEVIAAQVKELERLKIPQQYIDQWRQLKEVQASKDWADGAVRGIMKFRAEASDTAAQTEDAFNGLFTGIQSSTQNMWEDFLETGKLSLSSLKDVFRSFIAQLLNIAIMNPVVVQIATSVQGQLWGGSSGSVLAGPAQSGSGGVNIGGLTNLIPGSWTTGITGTITDTINNTMSSWFPNTFAGSGTQAAFDNLVTNVTTGSNLPTTTFTQSASDLIGGAGSFLQGVGGGFTGYSLSPTFGNMFSVKSSHQQTADIVSGIASTVATVATGNPLIAIPVAAIVNGVASLFGTKRKTHPSVYGKMEDVGYTTDTQTYIDAFMSGASYDRADAADAKPFAEAIGTAASQTAGTILDLAAALPDEYRQQVQDKLASATWTAGRGISGASWNLQWWDDGMAEERTTEAINDMMAQMGQVANKAFADAGIGDLFSSLDLSNEEGLQKAANAINSINTITTAIDQLKNPTTDVEAQATAFVEQIDALKTSVKSYGVNASYADALVEQYRSAYVDSYVDALDEMFNPLSEIEQQAQSYKTTIDSYVAALTTMGASEEQLAKVRGYTQTAINSIITALDESLNSTSAYTQAQDAANTQIDQRIAALRQLGATEAEIAGVEAKRSAAVQAATEEMLRSFEQTVESRRATLDGTSELVSLQQAQANELRSIIAQFGADSEQYAAILALQADELAAFNKQQAEAVAEAERQRIESEVEQQRSFYQNLQSRWATLNGTSDAVSRAISQENELREAVETFGEGSARVAELLRLQAAETAAAAVAAAQSRVDSLTSELASLEAQRVQLQQKAIQAEISSINTQLSTAKTLKDTWERLEESIEKSRHALWSGTTNIDAASREKSAQAEFDRLYKLAMSGDADAAGELASAGDTLLSLRQDTAANASEYMDVFYDVEGKLKAVREVSERQASAADKQVTALEKQLEAQQAQLDALNTQEATLEEINGKISTVGQALADAIKSLQLAQSNPNYVGSGSGGYVSWEDSLLQAKADAMNKGQTLAPGQSAGGWTTDKVLAAIHENGWTVSDWYDKHGRTEGFAAGGLAMPGWAMVGERGPELVNFTSPGRVYTAEQTQRMMAQAAYGTDGSSVAQLAWMRERMDRQVEIMNATYDILRDIRKYGYRTAENLDNMNENGIATTTKTSTVKKTMWAE